MGSESLSEKSGWFSDPGMLLVPSIQAPRSINLQRWQQKGRHVFCLLNSEGLPQDGHLPDGLINCSNEVQNQWLPLSGLGGH